MRLPIALALALAVTGCAAHRLDLPQGPGEPFPDVNAAFAAATKGCRDVRTLTAEARVSGAVGRGKVRGRVLLGFEEPGRLRLEAVAPMGPPAFILAASGGSATLLFPRSREVLAGEPADAVLEALIGVSLRADDLRAVLAGCVLPAAAPNGGRRFPDGWARVDVDGGNAVYLREEAGGWRVRAGQIEGLSIEYERESSDGPTPSIVRLRTTASDGPPASLRLALSQVEINTRIDPAAFLVTVPPDAVRITLADLKDAGPLGDRR